MGIEAAKVASRLLYSGLDCLKSTILRFVQRSIRGLEAMRSRPVRLFHASTGKHENKSDMFHKSKASNSWLVKKI